MPDRKTTRPPKHQLPDDEAEAVRNELIRLRDAMKQEGGCRAVGAMLGFPPRSDSQTIERAIRVRPGRETAERLYAALKTTREVFLSARGIRVAPAVAALDTAMWEATFGLDAEGARRIVETIKRELEAMAKPPAPSPSPPRLPPARRAR